MPTSAVALIVAAKLQGDVGGRNGRNTTGISCQSDPVWIPINVTPFKIILIIVKEHQGRWEIHLTLPESYWHEYQKWPPIANQGWGQIRLGPDYPKRFYACVVRNMELGTCKHKPVPCYCGYIMHVPYSLDYTKSLMNGYMCISLTEA